MIHFAIPLTHLVRSFHWLFMPDSRPPMICDPLLYRSLPTDPTAEEIAPGRCLSHVAAVFQAVRRPLTIPLMTLRPAEFSQLIAKYRPALASDCT